MGWQERDYARQPSPQRRGGGPTGGGGGGGGFTGGGGGGFSAGWSRGFAGRSVVFWIILINVVVFAADGLMYRAGIRQTRTVRDLQISENPPIFHDVEFETPVLEYWGHFSADTAILHGQVWRFVTCMFLHADIQHVLLNMIGLFFFGPMIEMYLGSRRFLVFYLLCGLAGDAAYLLLWQTGLVISSPDIALVGASAGVIAVIIAAARVAPNVTVYFMMIFPMPLRALAWIIVGIAAYTVLAQGNQLGSNAGGEAAHLGGAALGFFLIRNAHWLDFADRLSPRRLFQRLTRRRATASNAEVDRILDKVRDQGIQSLSDRERQTLQQATDQKRGRW